MPLFEVKIEICLESVSEVEESIALFEDGRLMVLEDKPSERAWLVAYYQDKDEVPGALAELARAMDPSWTLSRPEIRELADEDWRDSYKAHFHAWKFGRLHWIPVWERETFVLPEGDAAIWLDPGLAFGTGNHETTRLCCERLVTFAEARASKSGSAAGAVRTETVIDAGCGSGILALSAARLGFRDVSGFDNDAEAVRVSEENARLNGLEGTVPFVAADLIAGLQGRRADLVMANIQADVLMAFARELLAAVSPGGQLVLSGILSAELDRVRWVFVAAAPGWSVATRILGEWSDLVLDRP